MNTLCNDLRTGWLLSLNLYCLDFSCSSINYSPLPLLQCARCGWGPEGTMPHCAITPTTTTTNNPNQPYSSCRPGRAGVAINQSTKYKSCSKRAKKHELYAICQKTKLQKCWGTYLKNRKNVKCCHLSQLYSWGVRCLVLWNWGSPFWYGNHSHKFKRSS